MRVNPILVPVIVIVALLGTVFAAQGAGWWTTSGRTTVEAAQLSPADIKGWMTLQQVMDGLAIDQAALYEAGGIPSGVSPQTALKDLEGIVPGFDITALRDALSAQGDRLSTTEQPADRTAEPTPPPVAATPLAVMVAPASTVTVHLTPTLLPEGTVLPGSSVKGRMTLADISTQCAVPLDRLLAALNLPADANPSTAVKDLVSQGALSDVSVVQQAVTTLQSK